MSKKILKLFKSGKTVFKVSDLAILWNMKNKDSLKSKIYYLINRGQLIRLHHGIFTIDKKYNKNELANKLKRPSYVSLETILRENECIFQYSTEITSISNGNKNYQIEEINYSYRKIKDSVLLNSKGIINTNNYSIASKERAFLDMIYLNKNYYFDNLDCINWDKCDELVEIYQNISLIKRLKKYKKKYDR